MKPPSRSPTQGWGHGRAPQRRGPKRRSRFGKRLRPHWILRVEALGDVQGRRPAWGLALRGGGWARVRTGVSLELLFPLPRTPFPQLTSSLPPGLILEDTSTWKPLWVPTAAAHPHHLRKPALLSLPGHMSHIQVGRGLPQSCMSPAPGQHQRPVCVPETSGVCHDPVRPFGKPLAISQARAVLQGPNTQKIRLKQAPHVQARLGTFLAAEAPEESKTHRNAESAHLC